MNESCKCCKRHDIRVDAVAEHNAKRLVAFLKNDLSGWVTDHAARLLADDDDLSSAVIEVLRQRIELVFSLAMKIRTKGM